IWIGKGAQFVPGQSAVAKLSITVPQGPLSAQAWEISAGQVTSLKSERVLGGTKGTLRDFGLTGAIVFTADTAGATVARLQDQARQTSKVAAKLNQELAQEELAKVTRVQDELQKLGHPLPDGQALLENAQRRLQTSIDYWNKGDYREASAEAQRVLR